MKENLKNFVLDNKLNVISEAGLEDKYKIKTLNNLVEAEKLDIDCVFICNPTSLHMDILIWAAQNNLHIFVEKPISNNDANIDKLSQLIRNNGKITFVGKNIANVIDLFGKHLYDLNGEELNYSSMGERLSLQRNNFAHGNLDKEFVGLSLLDLVFLEIILYAMQLKYYGLEEIKIKKAINELFHKNFIIDE